MTPDEVTGKDGKRYPAKRPTIVVAKRKLLGEAETSRKPEVVTARYDPPAERKAVKEARKIAHVDDGVSVLAGRSPRKKL